MARIPLQAKRQQQGHEFVQSLAGLGGQGLQGPASPQAEQEIAQGLGFPKTQGGQFVDELFPVGGPQPQVTGPPVR